MTTLMLPATPALGSLPYDLNEARMRLLSVMAESAEKKLTEGNKIVMENEVDRLTTLLQKGEAMINRIVGGAATRSDSPEAVRAIITAIQAGVDGLYAIVGNGTTLDWAKNTFDDLGVGAKDAYAKVKEEVSEVADATVGKVTGVAPWVIIILVLVLGVVFFAGRIGR